MRLLILFLLAAIMLPACSTGKGSLQTDSQALHNDPLSIMSPANSGIPNADTEQPPVDIMSAPVPDGVDPGLWTSLTAELIRVVAESDCAATLPEPVVISQDNKQVSFTPYGAENRVDNFRITGSGPYRLTWTYRNSGDYDLNGTVNISDLTPVGMYYGHRAGEIWWPVSSLADGDGNGEINISDVTTIGQNFQGTITGYHLFGTDQLEEAWTHLGSATVAANLHKNTDNPYFLIQLDTMDYDYYALWPYDGSEDEGGWSNTTRLGLRDDLKMNGVKGLW